MKTFTKASCSLTIFAFLIVITSFRSFAQNYEPFADATSSSGSAYTVGSLLVGQTNASGALYKWVDANSNYTATNNNAPKIVAGNLTVPGLKSSGGNMLRFNTNSSLTGPNVNGGAGRIHVANPADSTAGNKYYFSLAMKITDLTGMTNSSTGLVIGGFNNSVGTTINTAFPSTLLTRLSIRTNSATTWQVGISKHGQFALDSTANWYPSSFTTNDTVLVVVKYDIVSGPVNDIVSMWVNPTLANFGTNAEPAADITAPTLGTADGGLASFVLMDRLGVPQGLFVDDLRINTTFAAVTPGIPAITSQPVGLTNASGSTAIFTTVATAPTATPITSYQWYKGASTIADGGNVSGATTASLTLANVTAGDAASYSVVIANANGSVTSSVAPLVVYSTPVINVQPIARTNNATTTATFDVVASGLFALYQWRSNGVDLVDGGNVSGATTATLTLSNVLKADEAVYSVRVTNNAGFADSDGTSTLTVIDPVITGQPASQAVSAGTNVTFNVTAVGTAPITYQWKKNGSNLSDDAKYSGTTTSSLTVSGIVTGDAGNYTVSITNSAGSADSSTAALTVASAPVITSQPVSLTRGAGSNAVFNVTVTGAAPISYQWKKDGTNLTDGINVAGSSTDSLTIGAVSQSDAGIYTVFVSNGDGSTNSSPATLTVIDPPAIAVQPIDAAFMPTSNVTFSVTATGTGPLSYQWKRNGSNLSDGGTILGATTASLSVSNISIANAGTYTVVVTNLAGSATSSNAVLTVGPAITVQPANRSVGAGTNATFTVTATGSATLVYQWRTNGTDLVDGGNISGATTATLTVAGAQHTDEGINFSVVVSNAIGAVTSSDASLTVFDAPAITLQPTNQTPNRLSTISLVVAATGTSPSYQWKKGSTALVDGGNVSGATTATLTLSSVSVADTASYTVVITNVAGSVTSSAASITVIYPLPYRDAFNYTAGANLEGQTNPDGLLWDTAGAVTANRITVTNVNLNVANLLASTGRSIQITGGATGPNARFSIPTGNSISTGTIYYSFLYKGEDLSNLNSTGGFSGGFNNSTGPQTGTPSVYYTRFHHRAATSGGTNGYNIGVAKASAVTWDPRFFTSNETVLVVGSYTFNPSSTDDVSQLWINPAATTFGAAAAPASDIAGTTGEADIASVASFLFRSVSGAAQPTKGIVDELRISRSWADVVPATPPVVAVAPVSITNDAGTVASFTVTATGTPNLTYQWKKNGTPLSDGGAVSGATSPNLTITGVIGGDAGAYSVTVSNVAGSVTSLSAALTVNDPVISSQPQNIATNTLQSATFTVAATGSGLAYQWNKDGSNLLDATNSSHTIPSTATNDAGGYQVVVTGTYGSVTSSVATLTVNLSTQSVTFAGLGIKTYGDAVFGVSATASSGNPVSFISLTPGVVSVSGTNVTILAAGSATIRASAGSDANYSAANDVDQSFAVTTAGLTVTANSTNRVYGAGNPAFTGSLVGLQYGDSITATYGTLADTNSPVGSYAITQSLSDVGGKIGNYTVTTNNGTLAVTAAGLTVTANDTNRYTGSTNPTFTVTYTGFVNGQTLATSDLAGSPGLTTSAIQSSPAGAYVITNLAGSLTSTNYAFSFVDGTLNVLAPAQPTSFTSTTAGQGSFSGSPGANYTVEYTDTLSPISWLSLTNVVTDGGTGVGLFSDPTDPATRPERYYRIAVP